MYTARHAALNRVVAVKVISAAAAAYPVAVARFRQEAEAVARAVHPPTRTGSSTAT